MNVRQLLCLACAALIAMPMFAGAEIYKWKDKDGVVRYSDTPPPSNIKQESMRGKKSPKATSNAPLSPVAGEQLKPVNSAKEPKEPAAGVSPEDAAAVQRQRNAEIEKKNKEEKEAQAKLKDENCKAAKANRESYVQGGRVYKMNEKGEREYMDDSELKQGAEKAQAEINEYCS
jgi:hypothetical protein